MSGEVNNNIQQNDYYAQLKSKNLSQGQLRQLDSLNGIVNDGVIEKDVFTIANSIIMGIPLEGDIAKNSALVSEVQSIMRGEVEKNLAAQYEATPRATVDADLVEKFLALSPSQTQALVELSKSLNGGIEGIDRKVLNVARAIVEQKTIQCDEGLWQQISDILQGSPSVANLENRQFGL